MIIISVFTETRLHLPQRETAARYRIGASGGIRYSLTYCDILSRVLCFVEALASWKCDARLCAKLPVTTCYLPKVRAFYYM